jgi:hypothetical protein
MRGIMNVRSVLVTSALALWASEASGQNFHKEVMCAAQAERLYLKDKDGLAVSANISIIGYEDHYNQKMGRCFMLEHTLITGSGSIELVTSLIDASEGHILARYSSTDRLEECELNPGYVTTHCKSGSEFDAFVEQYMGKVGRGVRHY